MPAFVAEKFDLAFSAIYVLPSGDLDCFAIDEGINYLLPSLLEVVPESFPGDAHPISSLVLLYLEKVAKTIVSSSSMDSNDFQIAKRDFSGFVIDGLWKA